MKKNTLLLVAGTSTLLQACLQFVLTATALAQYFCVIDLLRDLPLLLYVRIAYFHNPACDIRVPIGHAVDSLNDNAFVLLTQLSLPTYKTFIINSIYFGLSFVWILSSVVLIRGGVNNSSSSHVRWPWMAVMVLTFGMDISASISYITDSFHTRTLDDLVTFVKGVLSGAAGQTIDTRMASWLMVMVYSRFGITILFNIFLMICVLVDCGHPVVEISDDESIKQFETRQHELGTRIPRVSILRRVPTWLQRRATSENHKFYMRPAPPPAAINSNPTPVTQAIESEKKPGVNFPENLLSLPQRLENMIVEQQRRLDAALVDTSGRSSPPQAQANGEATQAQPSSSTVNGDAKGRRNTAAELQGQLPWSYILPNNHYMRPQGQAATDEDTPAVPVPDYVLPHKYRKASVHRAESNASLNVVGHNKDLRSSPLPQSKLSSRITETDVLY